MSTLNLSLPEFLAQHIEGPYQLNTLREGQVNTAWRVMTPSRHYFLKYQGAATHNGIDRVQEVRLQRALYISHLTPHVIAYSRDYAWLLCEWIDAPTLAAADPQRQVAVLANTLVQIHQQTPPLARWSLRRRVDNYLTAVGQYAPAKARALRSKLHQYRHLLAEWEQGEAVFCHNDLAFEHVLLAPKVKVVDWEYAGYGHAYFDLASAVEINQLDQSQCQQLCDEYNKLNGKQLEVEELAHWRGLLRAINELWHAAQQCQT